jgi:hypothetical protein
MCDDSFDWRVGTVVISHQGVQISAGQRRALEFQNRCKAAFLNPILADSIQQTLQVMEERKEQGVKAEQIWFFDYELHGTCSVAEWMGY